MNNKDFQTRITVTNTPQEVFEAVNNVRDWWSENIEGNTNEVNEDFLYHYKDVHICKLKIVELIPYQKVMWLVLDNHFNFTNNKSEWKGDKIVFDIEDQEGQTQLTLTHHGLEPECECYNVCNDAWTSYVQGSLKSLIETGKGKPNTQEEGLNAELINKWKLHKK